MSEIPEDIAATAERLRNMQCGSDDLCSLKAGCGCFDQIASAIMAERERCANIAHEWDGDIAAAIRGS